MIITFIPHPTRLLTSLDVGVNLATFTRTDAFASQLFNTSQTSIVARKMIELTEDGFVTEPSEARIIDHRMQLNRLSTEFDAVPFLSRMFRNAVVSQYEARRLDAGMEAQRRILRQARQQVDWDVERRLRPINEGVRELLSYVNEEFGLQAKRRDARTEENWLLASWAVSGRDTLLSNTPAPVTLPGSFANVKIHESLVNVLLGSLELEGKRGTVGEFKELLAERLRQPGLAVAGENDNVEITFASYNPIVVRFVDGRLELTISIAALRIDRTTHRNFQAIVRYTPAYDSDGMLILQRDNYISLINVRAQFVMRAIFGKIFPVNRPFLLVPKVLEDEPQFAYLTTGHCRIENGWFAIALVEKDTIDQRIDQRLDFVRE
jgi:hypothetical protein